MDGYSWVARSLSLYGRPSNVLYRPWQEKRRKAVPKQKRRHERRKQQKEADPGANAQSMRFWTKAKEYFAEVTSTGVRDR